jgi:hypothetical protein
MTPVLRHSSKRRRVVIAVSDSEEDPGEQQNDSKVEIILETDDEESDDGGNLHIEEGEGFYETDEDEFFGGESENELNQGDLEDEDDQGVEVPPIVESRETPAEPRDPSLMDDDLKSWNRDVLIRLGPCRPKDCIFASNDGGRRFNPVWYNSYDWLEYSQITHGSYCFICRFFDKSTRGAFVSVPWNNWKKATGKDPKDNGLLKHGTSKSHQLAEEFYANWNLNDKKPEFKVSSQIDRSNLIYARQRETNF